jgi:hypothetical protein
MHFVSDSIVESVVFPTVVLNKSDWVRNGSFTHIRQTQAAKLLLSIDHFLANTTAQFFIPMTGDVYLWAKNLKYLMESVQNHNYTGSSHFIWGNCLAINVVFLQGAVLFMSRFTAERIQAVGRKWFNSLQTVMDVDFTMVLNWTGLKMNESASEYIMAQYLPCDQADAMDHMNFSIFPQCPRVPRRFSDQCSPFQVQYNRLVLLHRLTACFFRNHPVPVYHYPSNLYWTMSYYLPQFCVKRRSAIQGTKL